jgi:hypothetical protein
MAAQSFLEDVVKRTPDFNCLFLGEILAEYQETIGLVKGLLFGGQHGGTSLFL